MRQFYEIDRGEPKVAPLARQLSWIHNLAVMGQSKRAEECDPVQVGGRDFALGLLFFHCGLNCLVAIELKIERFEPEYLGELAT